MTWSGASGSGISSLPVRPAAKWSYQPGQVRRCDHQLLACGGTVALGGTVPIPQVEDRVGGQADADDTGDQARHLGQRGRLGAALGEVAPEGVVEPARRGGRAPRLLPRGGGLRSGGITAPDSVGHRVGEVAGAVDIRGGQRAT